ncbi:hypothetical protein NDU88_001051 [Pleurodeles waltl]|uniref:Uncharacterized protein n=1 Tax=Pleurodeles waltl TaxID=8319 RepID=A0AAV7MLK3_PLEWA|nr:hypothetical protein NDU88_001051 [Pleurodeles waltl]
MKGGVITVPAQELKGAAGVHQGDMGAGQLQGRKGGDPGGGCKEKALSSAQQCIQGERQDEQERYASRRNGFFRYGRTTGRLWGVKFYQK